MERHFQQGKCEGPRATREVRIVCSSVCQRRRIQCVAHIGVFRASEQGVAAVGGEAESFVHGLTAMQSPRDGDVVFHRMPTRLGRDAEDARLGNPPIVRMGVAR